MPRVSRTHLRRCGTMIPTSIWRTSSTYQRASLSSDPRNTISEIRKYETWSNSSLPRPSGATDSYEPWLGTYGINIQAIGSYACIKAIRRPCGFGRKRSRTTRVEPIVKTYVAFLVGHGRTSRLRHLTIRYGLLRQGTGEQLTLLTRREVCFGIMSATGPGAMGWTPPPST